MFNFEEKPNLKGYTLILPTIAVGNVPQLTVDLLISSFDFKKCATIWHPAVISAVGPDPYDLNGTEICTACELYVDDALKLAAIQLRSTIDQKLALKFFTDLKEAILQMGFDEIKILTSSFDHEMHIVSSDKFFYISNEPNVGEFMSNINVKPKEENAEGRYLVHGSGFAVKLYETLCEAKLKTLLLIKHVSEGDNRPDAVTTLEVLGKIVKNSFELKNIKFPSSWSCVFGGPPPIGMY